MDSKAIFFAVLGIAGAFGTQNVHAAADAVGSPEHFERWLLDRPFERDKVNAYRLYLQGHLQEATPPMNELLTTARSWRACNQSPYEVPPQELWPNILPTLRLYYDLKQSGVLPQSSKIRSVYRNPELNRCAKGAQNSSHTKNAAIDIWSFEHVGNAPSLRATKDKLCRFWFERGRERNFGLGLYATEAIHLDTTRYRRWGFAHSPKGSVCNP